MITSIIVLLLHIIMLFLAFNLGHIHAQRKIFQREIEYLRHIQTCNLDSLDIYTLNKVQGYIKGMEDISNMLEKGPKKCTVDKLIWGLKNNKGE